MLVIDACGAGALPDAALYGDEGTNTLAHVAEAVGGLQLPALGALGLGSILPLPGVPPAAHPAAIHGRLHPLGPGKDSVTGHWELMGIVLEQAPPTYPEGFPAELTGRLVAAMGHEVICNRPDNGLAAIEEFGAEHLRSGALILYTSQDSVLQLAAHVERVPVQELYRACEAARAAMTGEHAVGRVIARPFTGTPGAFEPHRGQTRLHARATQRAATCRSSAARAWRCTAWARSTTCSPASAWTARTRARATRRPSQSVEALLEELDRGLVFANLIETDQVYGHRKDSRGFARALEEIDAYLAGRLARLRDGDLLIVTADHGVDPAHPGTDHTREYAPLLAVTGEMMRAREAGVGPDGARHDGPLADVGATVLGWLTGRASQALPGEDFLGDRSSPTGGRA